MLLVLLFIYLLIWLFGYGISMLCTNLRLVLWLLYVVASQRSNKFKPTGQHRT